MKCLKKSFYINMLIGAIIIGFSINLVAQTPTAPSESLVSGTEIVDGVEQMTNALINRLGLSNDDEIVEQIQPDIQNRALLAAAAATVAPVFSERTIDHLDLSGQSTNDSARKRISLGDFNKDGVEDVIVARWNNTAQLFINDTGVLTLSNGAFVSINDTSNAKHIGIIDANADGWLDLVAKNKLLLNRGNDTGGVWLGFAAGQTINGAESNPFAIRAADFDGDGDQDIVTTPGRLMLVNNGSGAFTSMPGRMDSKILSGVVKFDARDFDGDGDIDLAGPTKAEDEHFVYYNDGFGNFTNALRFSLDLDTLSYVQVAADFNDDNIADFRIYSDGDQPRAFMSTGTFSGGFPEYIRRIDQNLTGDNGKHGNAHIRDIDGDGDLDFILSSIELFQNSTDILNEKTEIIVNEGVNAGTFADFADPEWADEESYDAKIIDVNLDGNMDLLLAHRTRLAIYINNATAQVIEITGHTNSPSEVNTTTSMSVEFTGGSNPVFTWDMGDGSSTIATGSTPSVSHAYTTPGRHQVTVSVNDGENADSLVFWHTVFAQRTTFRPNASTTIVYETRNTNDRVWTVNPDHDTVSAIRIDNGALLGEIAVGEKPNSLALGGDGRLYVANKNDGTISIINTDTLTVESTFNQLPKAAQPHGLVFNPTNSSQIAYVTLEATGQLAQIDFDSSIVEIIDLGPLPRELSISNDGSAVYVSRFITPPVSGESTRTVSTVGGGEVWVVDGSTLSVQDVIQLPYNDQLDQATSARGIPNYLMTPLVSPSGLQAFVPANVSNVYRGQFRDGQNREHNMLVRSMLAKINLQTNTEEIDGRHDFDNSSQPTTGVFDPTGNYLYLVFQGSRKLRVFDIYAGISLDTLDLGFAPFGVTTSPDGKQVIAHNYLSRSIQVFDATSFVDGVSNQHVLLTEHDTTASEPLSATLLLGKRLFFDSNDERLSSQSYLSCAACHADGGHDGRTWDFSDVGEGLRNTIDLRGRSGTGHGLVHWTANFDEIHDFENDIRDIFKGNGLMSDADFANTAATLGSPKAGLSGDLDALAAFVSSLSRLGQSPYRLESGGLTPEAVAGRQIFADANCAACHSGSQFTDSVEGGRFHDIGTVDADTGGRLGSPLIDGGLDTPTLRGLWHGEPYLHDGSAATVEDAVLAHTSQEVGFDVSSLSQDDRDNLVAYLLQIDDQEQSAPGGNQVPVVTNPGSQTNTVGDNINLAITATDDDGDTLNYSATGLPDGLSINSNSGAITGTVTASGSFTVTVTVNDGNGGSDTASFVWDVNVPANNPPVLTSPGNRTNAVGDNINLTITATDDDGDTLNYSATGLPDGLSINSNSGAITGTVTASGSFTVTVTVNDGNGGSDSASFSWTVDPLVGPVCTTYTSTDIPKSLPVDTASVTSSLSVSANGTITDVDLSVDMEHDWVGDLIFTLIHQETGTSVTAMDQPGVSGSSTGEDSCAGYDVSVVLDDEASTSVESQCAMTDPAINGTFSPNNPLSAFDGESANGTWTLRVEDAFVEEDGGTLTSWGIQVCSNQGNSNQPPVITNPGPQQDNEADSVSLEINATDADGDALSYSATGLPDGLSINSNTGVISGTLAAGSAGSYNVTITVSDGSANNTASFSWVVNTVSGSDPVIYLSSTTGGTVGGVAFKDEDILSFNTATGVWSTYLDGSDVGLSADSARDISAFHVQADGSILLSVLKATTLPDVGSVDDSDIIRFVPSSLGTVTAGSFEFYFDGSDVGLTLDGEDIDALHVLTNGDLVISTIGKFSVPGVNGRDEDLIRFSANSLGVNTSGTWSLYFDGSDVGMNTTNTEDISGIWIDENSGDIYLSTRGEVITADNVSGTGADILRCQPSSTGTNTNCSFDSYWQGSSFGYSTENIDGLYIDR